MLCYLYRKEDQTGRRQEGTIQVIEYPGKDISLVHPLAPLELPNSAPALIQGKVGPPPRHPPLRLRPPIRWMTPCRLFYQPRIRDITK